MFEETRASVQHLLFGFLILDILSCLLRFIRATRKGDWKLHLEATEEMIPWFFAYDRVNYARYLPVYLLEILNLSVTHPILHDELLNGGFSVQCQENYGFSAVSCDQAIEETANRDSKAKGGLVEITNKSGAVHRWMLSHHLRAQISIACEQLAGKGDRKNRKKDVENFQVLKDNESVNNIVDTVSSMINPFTCFEEGLLKISSGILAGDKTQKDLENAVNIGKVAYNMYLKNCLEEKSESDIFSTI